ncbi:MAG: hypothetical protein J3K34DRAFT_518721 [Monoraphidium minutum]|nr:MAG: hypothetical protein J3K34DRAFT_518721 [Monoraphidium minutum]
MPAPQAEPSSRGAASGSAALLPQTDQIRGTVSVNGSTTSTAARQVAAAEFEFSLAAAKAKVLKGLEAAPPGGGGSAAAAAPPPRALLAVVEGPLFDRLARPLLLLFAARFAREGLARCVERARQQHLDAGYSPQAIAARARDLEGEEAAARAALSQPYAELILGHSSFKRPQRDRRFFEGVYAALESLLHEALGRLGREAAIATELGGLLRGPFNAAAWRHRPQRSVDTLSVEQIWALKHEGGNRALRGKLIASLNEKPSALSVQAASRSNTPLVAQAVASPTAACTQHAQRGGAGADGGRSVELRGLPQARAAQLLRAPTAGAATGGGGEAPPGAGGGAWGRSQQRGGGGGRDGRSAAASAAPTPRGGGGGAAQPPGGGSVFARAASMVGAVAAAVPAAKGLQAAAAVLPEAAGLPLDDLTAYLILLRRHVLHGPGLGFAAPGAAAPGAWLGPGPSASGALEQSPSAVSWHQGG